MIYKYLILLMLLFPHPAPAADSLGRLFLTPEQRTQLDLVRARRDPRQPVVAEAAPAAEATAPAAPQGPDTVTYNGVVRRSDGKSTVWINGKAVDERSRLRGAHEVNVVGMGADGAVSVAIPQASRTASLKVGQRLDVGSGKVEESYVQRRVMAGSAEREPPPVPAPAPSVPASQQLLTPAATAKHPPEAPATRAQPSREGYKDVDPTIGLLQRSAQ